MIKQENKLQIKYTLIKKGDYFLVKSAAQIESLMHIAYDPDAFLVGAVMLEISANASGGTDSTLFISLLEGIKDLIYGDNSAYEIGTRFVLDLLVRGGYQEGDYITSDNSYQKSLDISSVSFIVSYYIFNSL